MLIRPPGATVLIVGSLTALITALTAGGPAAGAPSCARTAPFGKSEVCRLMYVPSGVLTSVFKVARAIGVVTRTVRKILPAPVVVTTGAAALTPVLIRTGPGSPAPPSWM